MARKHTGRMTLVSFYMPQDIIDAIFKKSEQNGVRRIPKVTPPMAVREAAILYISQFTDK